MRRLSRHYGKEESESYALVLIGILSCFPDNEKTEHGNGQRLELLSKGSLG